MAPDPHNRAPEILFTVDLEDWFQVENFKSSISTSDWESLEWRFERNTEILLNLFERFGIKVTFFILGWNASRTPRLVKRISDQGHEVASHGYGHGLCYSSSKEALRKDFLESKSLLEDITGRAVNGYRAPSFSITGDAIQILKEVGYRYDSSYNSFGFNSRYGNVEFAGYKRAGIGHVDDDGFTELPISNLKFLKKTLPWGGGGYFRLLPENLFIAGVKRILERDRCFVFYIHPWEIDKHQPKVMNVNPFYRWRHYVNIEKCFARLERFIKTHSECSFIPCSAYVAQVQQLSENVNANEAG